MSHENIQLILFTTDNEQASKLKGLLSSYPNIIVAFGDGPEVSSRYHLDALWMTPMQASYYGAGAKLLPETATVYPMPKELRASGLPRLLIAGVLLTHGKVYSARMRASLPATCLAKSIAEYNAIHDDPILRVGSIPENLCLDSTEALDAIGAIHQAFSAGPIRPENRVNQRIRQRA